MRAHLWVYVREEKGKNLSGLLDRGVNLVHFRCDRCDRAVAVQRPGFLTKAVRRRDPDRQELIEACRRLPGQADEFKDCDLVVIGDVLGS